MSKHRLSVSVDAELFRAAERAVVDGRVESVSAWINQGMRLQLEHDERMAALDGLIEAHEAKQGVITDEEMEDAARDARAKGVVVRGGTVRMPRSVGRAAPSKGRPARGAR